MWLTYHDYNPLSRQDILNVHTQQKQKYIYWSLLWPSDPQLKLWSLAPSSVCIFPTTYYPIYRITICVNVHWPYNVNDTD